MTPQELEEKMNALIADMQQGNIGLVEYGEKLAELQKQFEVQSEMATRVEPEPSTAETELFDYRRALDPSAYQEAAEIQKEQQLDFTDAYDLVKRTREEAVRAGQYRTGEFDEPSTSKAMPQTAVSGIRPSVIEQGLVYDPETDTMRKAGDFELYAESLKPQVRQTEQQSKALEMETATQRTNYATKLRNEGYSKDEVAQLLNEYDRKAASDKKLNDLLSFTYKPAGESYVLESPLHYGLRMLNTGSALGAALYEEAVEGVPEIPYVTGGATSKGYEGYKQVEGIVRQAAVNNATMQGIWDAYYDYLPEDYRGGFNAVLGFGLEVTQPISPLGFGGAAKSVGKVGMKTLQEVAPEFTEQGLRKLTNSSAKTKLAMGIQNPVATAMGRNTDLLNLQAAETELTRAFQALGQDDPEFLVKSLADDIAEKGTLNSVTLREVGAQAIADDYAATSALDTALRMTDADVISKGEVGITGSPLIDDLFMDAEFDEQVMDYVIPRQELMDFVNAQEELFKSHTATQGSKHPSLSRARNIYNRSKEVDYEDLTFEKLRAVKVGDETRILGGTSDDLTKSLVGASADDDLLLPALRASHIINRLDNVEEAAPLLKKLADEGSLSIEELRELDSLSMVELGEMNPATIYSGTKQAVARAVQDDLLQNIPENYIYITKDYAVPTFRVWDGTQHTKAMREFQKAVQDLVTPSITENGQRFYTPEQAFKLKRFIRERGLDDTNLKKYLVSQLDIKSDVIGLGDNDLAMIAEMVSGELAREMLGGVKFRTGGLTAELAAIPKELRDTIVPVGKQHRTTNAIYAQGLNNAKAIIGKKGFKLQPTMTASQRRLFTQVQQANSSALEIVTSELQTAARQAPKGEASTTFDTVLTKYINKELSTDFMTGAERAQQRQEFAATARLEKTGTPISDTEFELAGLKGQYGDDSVNAYLRQNGIQNPVNLTQSDLTMVNRMINDMQRTLHRTKTVYPQYKMGWDFVLKRFFGAERLRNVYRQTGVVEGVLRVDKNHPSHTLVNGNLNIKPLTIENFKEVIEELRKNDKTLVGKGLYTKIAKSPRSEEAVLVPLLEYMVGLERKRLANNAIKEFVESDPSLLIAVGFDPTAKILPEGSLLGQSVKRLTKLVEEKTTNAVAGYAKLTPDGKYESMLDVDALKNSVREIVFDGLEEDIIKNTRPDVQMQIIVDLLGELVAHGQMNTSLNNFDWATFGIKLYERQIISSNTVDNLGDTIKRAYKREIDRLVKKKKPEIKDPKIAQMTRDEIESAIAQRNPNLINKLQGLESELQKARSTLSGLDPSAIDYSAARAGSLQGRIRDLTTQRNSLLDELGSKVDNELAKQQEAITATSQRRTAEEEAKMARAFKGGELDQLHEEIARELKDDFAKEYMLHLTGTNPSNTVSIYGKLAERLQQYLDTYGMSGGDIQNFLLNNANRVDYIGKDQMVMVYGADIADSVNKITEMASDARFTSQMNALRANEDVSINYLTNLASSIMSGTRRWQITHMLAGGVIPTTRFMGMNRITAPHIFFTSVGGALTMRGGKTALKFVGVSAGMGVGEGIRRGINAVRTRLGKDPMMSFLDSNRLLYAPDSEVIIKAEGGSLREWTAQELREALQTHSIEFSRTDIEFYESEIAKMLSDVNLTMGGKEMGRVRKTWAKFDPLQKNIYAQFAKHQDDELRRLVFVEALKGGSRVEDAAEIARRSMLDYNSMTDAEKTTLAKHIYFYSFTRAMGAESINAWYRAWKGGSPMASIVPRMLKAQAVQSEAVAEDYYAMTNNQLSRTYNLFSGTVDGQDLYISGAVNPQVMMFEFALNSSYNILSGTYQAYRQPTLGKVGESVFGLGTELGMWFMEGSPAKKFILDYAVRDPKAMSFPTEIITFAEQQGNLPELIKLYGLEPKPYKTPARPLSSEGIQYRFRKDKKGEDGYRLFLRHQIIGLSQMGMILDIGFLAAQTGMVDQDTTAMRTRAQADIQKAQQFAMQNAIEVPDPSGTGTIVIPSHQAYLKARANQVYPNLSFNEAMFAAYMLGLTTPSASQSIERRYDMATKNLLREIEQMYKTK